MAAPDDEFERILRDANSQLDGIHLELPALENGSPAPPSPQTWAIESLRPARKIPPWTPPALTEPKPPPVQPPPMQSLRLVDAVSENEEPPQRVRSVELPPEPKAAPKAAPTPARSLRPTQPPTPQPAPAEPNPAMLPVSKRPKVAFAAIGLAVAAGLWLSLRSTQGEAVILPVASFDAIAARDADEWLVSRQGELYLISGSAQPRILTRLANQFTSIFWTGGRLYGLDGKNAIFIWDNLSAPPRAFRIDHVPVAIYARSPNVWTLDEEGNLRQYILTVSMTGVFLQPLDFVALHHSGDFSIAEDGSLLLLERSSGKLLSITRDKLGYTATAHGSSYAPGARLVSSKGGLWIAATNGKTTTLAPVPRPSR